MKNTVERIGNRVRGIAAENGFTQQRVAEVLGLSRTSVVERMNGRVAFTADEVQKLATAMGEPITRFFPTAAHTEGGDGK